MAFDQKLLRNTPPSLLSTTRRGTVQQTHAMPSLTQLLCCDSSIRFCSCEVTEAVMDVKKYIQSGYKLWQLSKS